MSIPTAQQFVKIFGPKKIKKIIKFARVDANYESGRPQLIFDGESVASIKPYPYLSSYSPIPGDRVMVVNDVVVGKII